MYSRKMHILAEKHFEEKKIIFFAKTVQSISQQQHSEIGVQRMVPDHFPITFCLKKIIILLKNQEKRNCTVIPCY